MTFDELSDHMLGPMLDRMTGQQQRNLLLLLRQLEPPRAHPWIDRQLEQRELLNPKDRSNED
jgi:hypothetical protein